MYFNNKTLCNKLAIQNNIKKDLELRWDGADWIDMARDVSNWQTFVITEISEFSSFN